MENNFDFANHAYLGCPNTTKNLCENIFYKCNQNPLYQDSNGAVCKQYLGFPNENGLYKISILKPGEYVGKKIPDYFDNFGFDMILILGFVFLLNHLLYKYRGKK
jgi:hypothetical protein